MGVAGVFILSFFCLPAGQQLEAQNYSFSTAPTANAWVLFLFLPIPLTSFILGIHYKRRGWKTTKNIVVGVIFTVLLFAFGVFTPIFQGFYSHDMAYVDAVSQEVRFTLPDRGSITTQDMRPSPSSANSSKKQASSASGDHSVNDSSKYDSFSKIELTDQKQVADFEKSVRGSRCWVNSLSTSLSSIVPTFFSIQSSDTDSYLIYNQTLGTYNTVPSTTESCHYIFIAVSSKEDQMLIGEYDYAVAR